MKRFEAEVLTQAREAHTQMLFECAILERLKQEKTKIDQAGLALDNLQSLLKVWKTLMELRIRLQRSKNLAKRFVAVYYIKKKEKSALTAFHAAKKRYEKRFGAFDNDMKILIPHEG